SLKGLLALIPATACPTEQCEVQRCQAQRCQELARCQGWSKHDLRLSEHRLSQRQLGGAVGNAWPLTVSARLVFERWQHVFFFTYWCHGTGWAMRLHMSCSARSGAEQGHGVDFACTLGLTCAMPRIPAAAEADDFKPFVRPHSASGKYMMQLQDKTYVGLSSSDDWKVKEFVSKVGGEIAGKVFESARQRMSKRLRPQAAERLSEEAELPYIGWHLRRSGQQFTDCGAQTTTRRTRRSTTSCPFSFCLQRADAWCWVGRQRRLDKGKPRVTLAAGYNALNFGYASMLLLQVADLAPVHHLGETCWGYVRRSTKVPLESWGICSAEDLLLFAKETKWPREADDALESLGLKGLSETARAVHWTFALLGFCELTCFEAFVTKEYKIQHRPLALQCLASLADLAASVSTVNLRPRDVDGEAASVSTVKELIAAADWQPPVRHDDELPPAKVARKCIDANFVAKIYWPLCK
ncbi:unnamed protein product, partial [Effrenium voratum]